MSGRGLGGEDPFSRRAAAGAAFIPKTKPAADDEDSSPNQRDDITSINASGVASIDEETPVTSTVVQESAPSPPPPREPEGRTQMNARVRVDRMRALKKYQHQHRTTFQAVVDQMVDEYLQRRGLLPPDRT